MRILPQGKVSVRSRVVHPPITHGSGEIGHVFSELTKVWYDIEFGINV